MRVLIAEDDTLLREGLRMLLDGERHDVVAAVGDGEALLGALRRELAAGRTVDVAVLDVRMPPTHTDEGIRTAVAARALRPGIGLLVLSAYVEQAFVTDLLHDRSGGLGYLLKERVGRVDDFLASFARVAAGGTAVDPEVVAQLLVLRSRGDPLAPLTPRELEVLGLMAEGLGNAAIAARLVVSAGAVHKHVRSIFAKLGLAPDDDADRRVMAVLRYLAARR
ncbi:MULTISPECIES: LuxR C-terminal-related transcriptional regulator [unclassified Isoptericola]|uniref:LuxR C-terminal-related transcriptional regulator n=1 Tax=Isoptericola sp. NPDC057191 TaxID=3346041 RepID=UPI003634F25B